MKRTLIALAITATITANAAQPLAEAMHKDWYTAAYPSYVAAITAETRSTPEQNIIMYKSSVQDCGKYGISVGIGMSQPLAQDFYADGAFKATMYFDSNPVPVTVNADIGGVKGGTVVEYRLRVDELSPTEQGNLPELMRNARMMRVDLHEKGTEYRSSNLYSLNGSKAAMDDAQISCHAIAGQKRKPQQPAFEQLMNYESNNIQF